MIDRFYNLFFTQESSGPEQDFTTQKDILEKADAPESEVGICSPMSNLYTKYQMGVIPDKNFLQGSPEHIYNEALNERHHQDSYRSMSRDYRNSAFIDAGVEPKKELLSPTTLSDPEKARAVLEDKENILISIPQKNTSDRYHKIAAGTDKDDRSKCYFFDVNRYGGEKIDSCDKIYREISDTVKSSTSPKTSGNPVEIAYTEKPSKSSHSHR